MGNAQFVRVVIYLSLSAACCIIAGLTGIQKSRALSQHVASLQKA